MKRTLLLIIAALFSICLWPKKRIVLQKKERQVNIKCRTPSAEPMIDQEGSTLYLSFNGFLDKLQIVVKDGAGQIVYSDFLFSIFPNQCYTVSVGDVEDGVYILELNDGDTEYSGYFEIY